MPQMQGIIAAYLVRRIVTPPTMVVPLPPTAPDASLASVIMARAKWMAGPSHAVVPLGLPPSTTVRSRGGLSGLFLSAYCCSRCYGFAVAIVTGSAPSFCVVSSLCKPSERWKKCPVVGRFKSKTSCSKVGLTSTVEGRAARCPRPNGTTFKSLSRNSTPSCWSSVSWATS